MSNTSSLPIAVIGAGPVGLAAAAHLVKQGLTPLVFERGANAGATIAEWAHVHVFSPWEYNVDAAARSLLEADGWQAPDPDYLSIGGEIIRDYLAPLAAHPDIQPHIQLNADVQAITRQNRSKLASEGRDDAPFVIVWRDAHGKQRRSLARAVIDASGTWVRPNPIGVRAKDAIEGGHATLLSPFAVQSVTADDGALLVEGQSGGEAASLRVDRIIVATGFRPDLGFLSELRLSLDPIVEATPALAPLIDPNLHSCGTVRPHGVEELSQPEKDFYIVGMKSYGRAPTFLMTTGYEQVRSVVADLASDSIGAREVQLKLPETGVCNVGPVVVNPAFDHIQPAASGCCGATVERELAV